MTELSQAKDSRAILDRLDQDKVWVDQTGREWPLEAMTPTHRARLRKWLRRRADPLKMLDELMYLAGPAPTAEQASYAFDDEFHLILTTPPIQWLKERPLYRRLTLMVWRDRSEAEAR